MSFGVKFSQNVPLILTHQIKTKNILLPTHKCGVETKTSDEGNLQLTPQSIIKMISVETNEFIFVCKWGFNGSSGHGKAEQMFTVAFRTVEYLFLISIYGVTETRGYTHTCGSILGDRSFRLYRTIYWTSYPRSEEFYQR